MLSRVRRLRALEVRAVIKEGRARRASVLSMRYVATNEPLRAAAVVGKSLAKTAVMRNRLRRALYRALHEEKRMGRAVIFIQKMPKEQLQPVFSKELAALFQEK